LPVRTAVADIEAICGYLMTKPAGAAAAEVAAALGDKSFDWRRLLAVKFWGLVEDTGAALRLTERGRLVVSDHGAHRAAALRQVLAAIPPYGAAIASAVHRNETTILAPDIAAHWHRHFRGDVQFGILNHQIVCFLRIAEGADLGRLVVGRKGQQTRFELAQSGARAFVDTARIAAAPARTELYEVRSSSEGDAAGETAAKRANRVFITHRSSRKIIDQVQELVTFGKFEPVVARDRETSARPFLQELMGEMRGCDTAVIHVGADALVGDVDQRPRISGDVLIEIGAAMALFGRNFVLLVEEGVELPPNLQGPCECRYSGEELNMPATMMLFKAFNDFTTSHPARPLALAIGPDHVVPHLLHYERTISSPQG